MSWLTTVISAWVRVEPRPLAATRSPAKPRFQTADVCALISYPIPDCNTIPARKVGDRSTSSRRAYELKCSSTRNRFEPTSIPARTVVKTEYGTGDVFVAPKSSRRHSHPPQILV